MIVDEEAEKEDKAEQHQQQPYQLTPCYRECFMVAQQQLDLWLTDCHILFWDHFEKEQRIFYEEEQHREHTFTKFSNSSSMKSIILLLMMMMMMEKIIILFLIIMEKMMVMMRTVIIIL
jgi:hypothetical protein